MKKFLSRAALKYIAVVTMLIDHIGYTIVWTVYAYHRYYGWAPLSDLPFLGSAESAYAAYKVCRRIGRAAFPIFAYFVAEGFMKTRDLKKYVIRMALFAAAAEIPYNLCFGRSLFTLEHNNVIFTHLLGLLTLICLKKFTLPLKEKGETARSAALTVLFVAGFCLIAQPFDGGVRGILMIVSCWLFHDSDLLRTVRMALANMVIVIHFGPLQLYALVGIFLLCLYDGRKGAYPRYFFYLFYTLHLLVLYRAQGALFGLWH